MTLQDFKDQVATGNGFKNWSELKDYCDELTGSGQLLNYHEEAFELAIQSAREEARTEGYNDGYKSACADRAEKDKLFLNG